MTGNKSNKLKTTDVQSYVLWQRNDSPNRKSSLYEHFQTLSGIKSDNLIDIEEFKMAFGLSKSNFFVERMFHIFDRNGDGKITFRFLEGLSVLCHKLKDRQTFCTMSLSLCLKHDESYSHNILQFHLEFTTLMKMVKSVEAN